MIPDKHKILCIVPDLLLPSDVAIVGSSARLKEGDFGQKIDKHETVIRFNRAPVSGYEKYVGSKTSLRVTNNHVFNNNDEGEGWESQPRYFIKELQNERILYFASDIMPWMEKHQNTNSTCELHCVIYSELIDLRKQCGIPWEKDFSVGVGMIFLCLTVGIKPHLYGFDVIEDTTRSHYWENRPPPGGSHSVSVEKQWLRNLIDNGLVINH
tara:strand:- start:18192 stop:18824 length:633 start_codon:yes stop_codon:yes gene_type:complete